MQEDNHCNNHLNKIFTASIRFFGGNNGEIKELFYPPCQEQYPFCMTLDDECENSRISLKK